MFFFLLNKKECNVLLKVCERDHLSVLLSLNSLLVCHLFETVEAYHEVSVVESVDSKHGLLSSTHATDKTLRDFG